MKKLQMRISYAFGDHAFHWLPDLLNFHGVTAVQFKGLLLRDKPALVREILVNDNPKLKYPLRNYLKQHPKSNGAALFSYATKGMDIKQASAHQTKLKYWATQLAEENRLYDTEEGVKSELAGSFSFNDYNPSDDGQTKWECNTCDAVEVTGEGDQPFMEFSHLFGPYYRCDNCDTCQRLGAEPCGYEDDNEEMWDDYVDHLGELLGQLKADLKKKGLPDPDGLYVGARNVDWRGRDGHCLVGFDAEELARGVSVNSEFTISRGRLFLPETAVGYLSCRMSHHDVPMGGGVTITPYWHCEMDGDPVVGDEITSQKFLARAAEHLFCGPYRWQEFHATDDLLAVSERGFTESVDNLISYMDLFEGDPIHHFLKRLDPQSVRVAEDAAAIRSLIDERMEREDAA